MAPVRGSMIKGLSNSAIKSHVHRYSVGHLKLRAQAQAHDDEPTFDRSAAREVWLGFVFCGACLAQVAGDATGRLEGSLDVGTAAYVFVTAALPCGGVLGCLGAVGLAHRRGRRPALLGAGCLGVVGVACTAITSDAEWLAAGRLVLGVAAGGVSGAARSLLYEEAGHEGELALAAFLPALGVGAGAFFQTCASWLPLASASYGWRYVDALPALPALLFLRGLARDRRPAARRRRGMPSTVAGRRFANFTRMSAFAEREADARRTSGRDPLLGSSDDGDDASDGDAASDDEDASEAARLARDVGRLLKADDALLAFEDHRGFQMAPAPKKRAIAARAVAVRLAFFHGVVLGVSALYTTLTLAVGGFRSSPLASCAAALAALLAAAAALFAARLRPRRLLARIACVLGFFGAALAGASLVCLGVLQKKRHYGGALSAGAATLETACLVALAAALALHAAAVYAAYALPDAVLTDSFLAHAHARALENVIGRDREIFIVKGLAHAMVVARVEAQRFAGAALAGATAPFLMQILGGERLGAYLDDDRERDGRAEAEAKRGAGVLYLALALLWALAYYATAYRLRSVGGVLVWRDRAPGAAVDLTDEDASLFEAVFDSVTSRIHGTSAGTFDEDDDDDDDDDDSTGSYTTESA